jgi:cytochrome b
MSTEKQTSDHDQKSKGALIWDLPLRFFHWSMVILVTVGGITGYFAEDSWLNIHALAGYGLGLLLIFRLLWGFLGSPYSRFKNFPLNKQAVIDHFRTLIKLKPASPIGHNPVGAWMIVILLSTLTLLILSGMITYGGQENLGPLASLVNYTTGHFTKEIHEILSTILLFAIGTHLLGVFSEVVLFKHPLIKAMITGRKPVDTPVADPSRFYILKGIVLFVGIIATCVYIATKLEARPNPAWTLLQAPISYESECSDCHALYHPSLRSSANWASVMDNLSDHFGEDASLNETSRLEIKKFLMENDASTFDTEVSHRIGRAADETLRMTDTKYWKKRHHDIDDALFKSKEVGSKINCTKCHKDAVIGRFDDENIQIPKGSK